MNKLVKAIPNIITSFRIVGAIVVFFLEPFSIEFFVVYGVCGVTDALDGFIARRFHLQSKIGSILDSASDIIFLTVMAIKIFPTLMDLLAIWNWIIIIVPVFFHVLAYIVCAIKYKKFSAIHTYANKVMSAAIFFYPFMFIGQVRPLYEIYAIVFGSVAIFGSIEINLIHILSKTYDEKNKSIFLLKRNQETSEVTT